jgi:hypothetical protein
MHQSIPFTVTYTKRISQIHELREIKEKTNQDDTIFSRSAIGSTFRTSSADLSKNFSGDRTFGLVRPLRSRENSTERTRERSGSVGTSRMSDADISSVDKRRIQRTISNFDKELQVQKDLAANERQKLALLQVKKESYVNYLKNKGNTPWIPGGAGDKHETSLHKSINKSSADKGLQLKAWCRSPWPGNAGQHRQSFDETTADENDNRLKESEFSTNYSQKLNRNANLSPQRARSYSKSSNWDASSADGPNPNPNPGPNPGSSPSGGVSLPGQPRTQVSPSQGSLASLIAQRQLRAPTATLSPTKNSIRVSTATYDTFSGDFASETASATRMVRSNSMESILSTGTGTASVGSYGSTNRRPRASSVSSNATATAGQNSKYVALTVRLVDLSHPAQKSTYGVFIVPRNCTRLELIGNIERQFNVANKVSDISITYRGGYGRSTVIKSLSMGTIADVPQIDDYSSIAIYLGGKTIFDASGNINHGDGECGGGAGGEAEQQQKSALPAGMDPMMTVLRRDNSDGAGGGVLSPIAAVNETGNFGIGQFSFRTGAGGMGGIGGGAPANTTAASEVGLAEGDHLLYFSDQDSSSDSKSAVEEGDMEVTSFKEEEFDDEMLANSMRSQVRNVGRPLPQASYVAASSAAAAAAAVAGRASNVQVPLYEALHPDQPMHGFSSPTAPLGHRQASMRKKQGALLPAPAVAQLEDRELQRASFRMDNSSNNDKERSRRFTRVSQSQDPPLTRYSPAGNNEQQQLGNYFSYDQQQQQRQASPYRAAPTAAGAGGGGWRELLRASVSSGAAAVSADTGAATGGAAAAVGQQQQYYTIQSASDPYVAPKRRTTAASRAARAQSPNYRGTTLSSSIRVASAGNGGRAQSAAAAVDTRRRQDSAGGANGGGGGGGVRAGAGPHMGARGEGQGEERTGTSSSSP